MVLVKRGIYEPVDHALGRSRGGLTTREYTYYAIVEAFRLRFHYQRARRADSTFLTGLLREGSVSLDGQADQENAAGISWPDKGYDSDALRHDCTRYGMRPIIPQRRMHRRPKPGLPHQFDRPKYRQRVVNVVERLFGSVEGKASAQCALRQAGQ